MALWQRISGIRGDDVLLHCGKKKWPFFKIKENLFLIRVRLKIISIRSNNFLKKAVLFGDVCRVLNLGQFENT